MQHDEDVNAGNIFDPETGLPNRHGFEVMLAMEERRSRRHGGVHSIVRVDVPESDGIVEIAANMAESLRDTDILARVGYVSFAVLAIHCHDARVVIDRLERSVAGLGVDLKISSGSAGSAGLAEKWRALSAGIKAVRARSTIRWYEPSELLSQN